MPIPLAFRLPLAALGLASLLSVAACQDAASSGPGVASLAGTASATAAPTTGGTDAGRPTLPLDESGPESMRIMESWFACLKDNGVPMGAKTDNGTTLPWPKTFPAKGTPAYQACLSKDPLPPPALDPVKNPHYQDDFRAWVQCMNNRGLKVTALPDGSGWNYDSQVLPPNAQQIEVGCQSEAFGAGH
jgi:hypothetical protein